MTPSELKDYLQGRSQATLSDLIIHFDSDADTIKSAIGLWIRKGKVEENSAAGCDKGCCQCDPMKTTVYRWKH